ncbi:AlbA family DNA-binding domain-containing protein [Chelatococcus reniformis]|uniref:Schlafen AlbA-2 domain-containing protein n=1 Tax=Chelatococcus reniformis TaxID=1494448 RepID=A0A916X7X7_9HYPH|nr:ATP-binding protein [Chelatococcus reniformis]GGC48929.1 hypothetical protein GCM10010994_05120 [Chelatococcus reniformis]
MTDEEIGLVKAMLARGIKNEQAHFYFNRADRLISSGRITYIKQGKYGASVPEATPAELDTFIVEWERRQLSGTERVAPDHANAVLALFERGDPHWTLRAGETHRAECKLSFRLSPERLFADAVKTIAAFANHSGGYLLFGVHNATLAAQGLAAEFFAQADPAEINRLLASALDPVPIITKLTVQVGLATVGVLHVEKHAYAPVMALKMIGDSVKEGHIYYRYVGESRAIKPGELREIIAARERRAVGAFVRQMNMVQAGSAATLNLETGEVAGRTGGFVIDRDLLSNIQFIKEGEFSETRGAPALKLIGEVKPVNAKEEERIKTIRDTVTPDAILRNFLRQERVADPMQYIHAQAHYPRRWMPLWFYVEQTGMTLEEITNDMIKIVANQPSSRDAVVKRLQRGDEAYKIHPGRPTELCKTLQQGGAFDLTTAQDISRFANAVMGLMDGAPNLDTIREALASCIDRSMGPSAAEGGRRSMIFRAACRVDELMHRPSQSRPARQHLSRSPE